MEVFLEPVAGIIILKFKKIQTVPLVHLRNQTCPEGFCLDSFRHFFEKLVDDIDENSVDLNLYEEICKDISNKYFLMVGYTTNLDINRLKATIKKDYDHLLYFYFSDIVFGDSLYRKETHIMPYIVDERYLKEQLQLFEESVRHKIFPF